MSRDSPRTPMHRNLRLSDVPDFGSEGYAVEEQYVADTPQFDPLAEPPHGTRYWKPYFEGEELVERIMTPPTKADQLDDMAISG